MKGITRRQGEVLDLVARGMSNAQISAALGIGYTTVKNHLVEAFDVLGVNNRTEAAIAWRVHEESVPLNHLESALLDIEQARTSIRRAVKTLENKP